MTDTFWAIRRRELAKHEAPAPKKPKKAKKAVVAEPVEEPPVVEVEAEPVEEVLAEPEAEAEPE